MGKSSCGRTLWFDYNDADQHALVFLQGERRPTGSPADGVLARQQVAQVLVTSLISDAARHKILEFIAENGPAPAGLEPLFADLAADPTGSLDAITDTSNMPLDAEPATVRTDLAVARERAAR